MRSCLVPFFVVMSFKSVSVILPLGTATEQIRFCVKWESGEVW